MYKSFSISLIFFLFGSIAVGQIDNSPHNEKRSIAKEYKTIELIKADILTNDTVYIVDLPVYIVYDWMVRPDRKTRRLIRNVKKVYPYAKLAGIKIEEYSKELEKIKSERKRKRFMRKVEKDLDAKFGDDLRHFTFTQGKILIKLIDRETGDTSYVLVKELRGKFVAFFWQSFARLFGMDLKNSYDPEGKDKMIEQIVQSIERGEI